MAARRPPTRLPATRVRVGIPDDRAVIAMATELARFKARFLAERAALVAPRVNPLMDSFTRAEAMRADQPSRPPPPDPAASGIARTQLQVGTRDAPPPSPDMTATPAERAPGFVPRVNLDPLTGEAAPTQVPTVLRLRAAIKRRPPRSHHRASCRRPPCATACHQEPPVPPPCRPTHPRHPRRSRPARAASAPRHLGT